MSSTIPAVNRKETTPDGRGPKAHDEVLIREAGAVGDPLNQHRHGLLDQQRRFRAAPATASGQVQRMTRQGSVTPRVTPTATDRGPDQYRTTGQSHSHSTRPYWTEPDRAEQNPCPT
jgi:hypothetical protein